MTRNSNAMDAALLVRDSIPLLARVRNGSVARLPLKTG